MTDDRFWPRNFAALHPVILSADHARSGQEPRPRRNLGWGQPPVSPVTGVWTARAP